MPRIDIAAADASTEIFVVSHDFSLAERGTGRLSRDLEEGLYKVLAVSGRSSWQEIVVLDQDLSLHIPPIAFGSATPLSGTAMTHESHMAAAEQATGPAGPPVGAGPAGTLSFPRDPVAGMGARLSVMARWWTPEGIARNGPFPDPARGASLRTAGGRHLVRLGLDDPGAVSGMPRQVSVDAPGIAPAMRVHAGDADRDRFTTLSLGARPGIYTLRLTDGARAVDRMITLLEGWQTQVFALYEPPDGRLTDLSIVMSRGAFSPSDEVSRLTDAARFALADERSLANERLLEYARGKHENPMLGLLSAHLLLVLRQKERERAKRSSPASEAQPAPPMRFEQALFDEIVDNTSRLFGEDHPDIRALRLDTADGPRVDGPLGSLPMMSRGWERLLEASLDAPDLVPAPLWRRAARRSLERPFLSWTPPRRGGVDAMQVDAATARMIVEALARNPDIGAAEDPAQAETAMRKFKLAVIRDFDVPRSYVDMVVPERAASPASSSGGEA